MSFPRRCSHRAVLGATVALLGAASPALADPVFTLRNNSGLAPADARYFYLGYGTVGKDFVVLSKSGSWIAAGSKESGWSATAYNPAANGGKGAYTGAGVVPCYPLTTGQKITIPPNILGARVYFFQVAKGTALFDKTCGSLPATDKTVNGIFGNKLRPGVSGQAPFSYFTKTGGGQMSGASISQLTSGVLPLWTFSEIASSSTAATIDTSQVDFVGFPMNVTAQMLPPGNKSVPAKGQGVGFSFSPNSEVNMAAVVASYQAFLARLPASTRTGTTTVYPRGNYNKLLASSPGGKLLINPGNLLSFVDRKAFPGFFDNLVNSYMWKPGWKGSINIGGKFKPLPQVVFKGVTVRLKSYPGYKGVRPLYAIRFTATADGKQVVAYLLSPQSYQVLCAANAIAGCAWMTPAYQIFATDGALNVPPDGNQFKLLTTTEKSVWTDSFGGSLNYSTVVARLGLIVSMAYNNGVAGGLQTAGGLCAGRVLSACWSDQSLWYPNPPAGKDMTKLYFTGDTSQNEFARWLHTATIGALPMMTRPTLPTKTQSGIMNMGYGFASDENPTPPNATYSQTPSKYDSNVPMTTGTGCNFITIMPWRAGAKNPSPVSPGCN